MNTRNRILVMICLFAGLHTYAQQLTPKQQEREANKVEIYTPDEKDNLQMWFYEQVNQMGLTESLREEYYGIILYHTSTMMRLNDKDKDYTDEEIKTKFEALVVKINTQVKPILSEIQYGMHLENFGRIVRSVQNKLEKNKS